MVSYGSLMRQVLVRHHHGAFRYGVFFLCVCVLMGDCGGRVYVGEFMVLGKEENLCLGTCVVCERERGYGRDMHEDEREREHE